MPPGLRCEADHDFDNDALPARMSRDVVFEEHGTLHRRLLRIERTVPDHPKDESYKTIETSTVVLRIPTP